MIINFVRIQTWLLICAGTLRITTVTVVAFVHSQGIMCVCNQLKYTLTIEWVYLWKCTKYTSLNQLKYIPTNAWIPFNRKCIKFSSSTKFKSWYLQKLEFLRLLCLHNSTANLWFPHRKQVSEIRCLFIQIDRKIRFICSDLDALQSWLKKLAVKISSGQM